MTSPIVHFMLRMPALRFPAVALGVLFYAAAGLRSKKHDAYILTPLLVQQPLPHRLRDFRPYVDKYVPVVASSDPLSQGVQVVATKDVPDAKVQRVANVLAQFLDNDQDGVIDNQKVARAMLRHGATMIMFNSFEDLESSSFEDVPGFDAQDQEGEETADGNIPRTLLGRVTIADRVLNDTRAREGRCFYQPSLVCDAALEEVFHLVTESGFARAYPEFRTDAGSSLAVTMDALIGNCGFATKRSPLAAHTTLRFPDCSGIYHYDDPTCGYHCLVTEYFHHFIASYNGEYSWSNRTSQLCNGSTSRALEWELCRKDDLNASRELLLAADPDGSDLILDPQFNVPTKMPDGQYRPSTEAERGTTITTRRLEAESSLANTTLRIDGFERIVLEGPERHRFRSQAAATRPTLRGAPAHRNMRRRRRRRV